MEKECLRIAAKMFGGDVGLLNYQLADEITQIDVMVRNSGGILVSRQAIAIIIYQWLKENPDKKPYGE